MLDGLALHYMCILVSNKNKTGIYKIDISPKSKGKSFIADKCKIELATVGYVSITPVRGANVHFYCIEGYRAESRNMDQTAYDSSSLGGKSSRLAGFVCYNGIKYLYFFSNRNDPGSNRTQASFFGEIKTGFL